MTPKEKLITIFCGDGWDITAMAELKVDEIIKEIEANIMREVVENILDKFYEGDWVSQANALWTNENTAGYIRAKEEFEKFLKGITLQ